MKMFFMLTQRVNLLPSCLLSILNIYYTLKLNRNTDEHVMK